MRATQRGLTLYLLLALALAAGIAMLFPSAALWGTGLLALWAMASSWRMRARP